MAASVTWIDTDIPEPTFVYHQVHKPDLPLDRLEFHSILNWINYSLAQEDFTIFETLALESVHFGISEAEFIGRLERDTLIRNFQQHVGPETQCLAYTYRPGEINSLDVFIANWGVDWDFGRRSNDLIVHFSDQFTPETGFALYAISIPYPIDQYAVLTMFETPCF